MTEGRHSYQALTVGCPVYTADDTKLGVVKEVRGRSFQVDALLRLDYWLTTDTIRSATPERITVIFGQDHLRDYTQDAPTLV